MGKDLILETAAWARMGVKARELPHHCWWSSLSGMGDDIQAIKAGVLEIGDVYVATSPTKGAETSALLL